MRHCKDCEPAQTIHWLAYWGVWLTYITEPFYNFMGMCLRPIMEPISNRLSIIFIKSMVFLKLGYFTNKPNDKNNLRAKCFWDEAIARGIKMREFHMGPVNDTFLVEYNGKTLTFGGLPRINSSHSASFKWMDDKGKMSKKFKKIGIPVADGGVAMTKKRAIEIFKHIRKPVITKPNLGSRSRHTTIHINTTEELIIGFKKANILSPFVIVEEELHGSLFRASIVDGKLEGVVRRDPPQITGDGIHTVRELWQKENNRPERAHGPIFHQITYDKDAEVELTRQDIAMEPILMNGQIVTFSQKTSRGVGGSTTEVTKIVHKDNIEMFEKLGAFLKDPLVGVDFIMEDITKSGHAQPRAGIIECNSLPFIDLHCYALFGEPNNVAAKLWDFVFPESKLK